MRLRRGSRSALVRVLPVIGSVSARVCPMRAGRTPNWDQPRASDISAQRPLVSPDSHPCALPCSTRFLLPLRRLAALAPNWRKPSTAGWRARAGARVRDLLFHLPVALTDRRLRASLSDVTPDTVVDAGAAGGRPSAAPASRGRKPYRVLCEDAHGHDVMLVYFHAHAQQMDKLLPVGAQRWISGRIEQWDGHCRWCIQTA